MQLSDGLKTKAANEAKVKPKLDLKAAAVGAILTPFALVKKAPKAIGTGFLSLLRLWLKLNIGLISPEIAKLLDDANKPQQAAGQRKPIHELMQTMWDKMTPEGMIPRKVPQFVEGVDGETRDIERLYAKEHTRWVTSQATTPEAKEKAAQLTAAFYQNFPEARVLEAKDDAIIRREGIPTVKPGLQVSKALMGLADKAGTDTMAPAGSAPHYLTLAQNHLNEIAKILPEGDAIKDLHAKLSSLLTGSRADYPPTQGETPLRDGELKPATKLAGAEFKRHELLAAHMSVITNALLFAQDDNPKDDSLVDARRETAIFKDALMQRAATDVKTDEVKNLYQGDNFNSAAAQLQQIPALTEAFKLGQPAPKVATPAMEMA